jgi:hypothetical protein
MLRLVYMPGSYDTGTYTRLKSRVGGLSLLLLLRETLQQCMRSRLTPERLQVHVLIICMHFISQSGLDNPKLNHPNPC